VGGRKRPYPWVSSTIGWSWRRPARRLREGRPGQAKAPGCPGPARDPDARSDGDRDRRRPALEPKWRLVQRQAVLRPRDAQGLAQATRAGAELPHRLDAAPCPHDLQPGGGLDRPDQHGTAQRLGTADGVEAPVQAVGAIDIGVPGWTEHGGIARRTAPMAVRGGILMVIGLGLDDQPADPVDQQPGPDQITRHRHDVAGEEGTWQHVRVRQSAS
jgi:hypothetical protein